MPGECHCEGWGCRRCTPQPDAGEQGATVADKEVLALQGRVRELEVALRVLTDAAAKCGNLIPWKTYAAARAALEKVTHA